jgi:putative ABC transport system substrate-binding protein
MKRREFIVALVGAAAWPVVARAQESGLPVIGYLNTRTATQDPHLVAAFRRGLGQTGFIENRNVAIDYRWANGQFDRLPELANDLVSRRVSVIAALAGEPAARAAKAATATIPILFVIGSDPVALGFVSSLERPSGNMTGATMLTTELMPKRLEVLHELLPSANVLAALANPSNPSHAQSTREAQQAARVLGVELRIFNASSERELDMLFARVAELRGVPLVVPTDPFFNAQSKQLAVRTLQLAIPAMFGTREAVAAGGLMSYGDSLTTSYHLAGVYAGRILKSEKPADLPVQQVTHIELVINMKTAKTLGLTVPDTLLARADEVIE